jgi:hypothetical protein
LFGTSKKYIIVVPNNKKMACKYGVGTKWCTANKEHNAFDSYNDDKLYIFLNKDDKLKPEYQFHFKKEEFKNKNNISIDIEDFFNENKYVYKLFFPEVEEKIEKKKN